MMYRKILLLLYVACLSCQAQDNGCKTVTLGKFFHSVKSIDVKKRETLSYKKYSSFSYKDFKPISDKLNENDFFEVGYSGDEIKEIIHHQRMGRLVSNKLTIHEFEDYRILIYQIKFEDDKEYSFTPTAFIMLKKPAKDSLKNFMITLVPQFGEGDNVYKPGFNYREYPVGKFEDISAIMVLDGELYPTDHLRIANGQIVFDSHIYYSSNKTVDYESVSIFFCNESHPNLKVNEDTCLGEIIFHNESPDMVLPLHPAVGANTMNAPLWIFSGAHDYKQ